MTELRKKILKTFMVTPREVNLHGTPHFATQYFPDDPTYVETNCGISEEAIELLVDKLEGKSAFVGKPRIKQAK